MASLNKCSFIGRVGKDPKISYTQDGKTIARISLACSQSWKDKNGNKQERTEWVPISIFGKLADIVQQYVTKGSQLYVEGKYTTRKWQDQNGQDQYMTEITLSGFDSVLQMLDNKKQDAAPQQQATPQQQPAQQPVQQPDPQPPQDNPFDDDIPF